MSELTNAEFIVSASRLKRHVLECNWLQRKVSRILFQPVAPTSLFRPLGIVGTKQLRRINSMVEPRAGLVPVEPRSQPEREVEMTSATGGACLRRAMIRT